MASADYVLEDVPEMAPSEVSEIWLGHLMSFLIPLTTLAFVWTGPHSWYAALLFIAPLAIFHWMDVQPHYERRQPVETLPSWPFNIIVYLLVIVHFAVLVGLVRLFAMQSVFSFDMLMVFVLVGGSSGFSIITAHELIHRGDTFSRLLGRLMLSTVLYEHFYTEHLRGHHVRVGTAEDPATARFGESYREFWRRTVPGQFRSAWRLEADRLEGRAGLSFPARLVENRIIQGLVVGWAGVAGVLYFFGPVACLAYILQALVAVRLLEAVNYFEHWGLER
ncbi:MAG: fatty acid desaturase, partial [Myxococcota bacterium]|nr:fatty acid desaturase [Myxococcota bacterium]